MDDSDSRSTATTEGQVRRNITAKPHERWSIAFRGKLILPSGRYRTKWGARDLWEDWEHAFPFTAGKHFFNVGLSHEVAFAAHRFGGVRGLPRHFDNYEELARKVEHMYVRGWVEKNGERMFLWDDFNDVAASSVGHFVYFEDAVRKLRRRGYAWPSTEIWDRGGERYIDTLGGLNLLAS